MMGRAYPAIRASPERTEASPRDNPTRPVLVGRSGGEQHRWARRRAPNGPLAFDCARQPLARCPVKPNRSCDSVRDLAVGAGDRPGRHGDAATIRRGARCCAKGSIAIRRTQSPLNLSACSLVKAGNWPRAQRFRGRASLPAAPARDQGAILADCRPQLRRALVEAIDERIGGGSTLRAG
jgi:hypothetical protein